MHSLYVEFTTASGQIVKVMEAQSIKTVGHTLTTLKELSLHIEKHIKQFSCLLDSISDPLLKGLTHAMLCETLHELGEDTSNFFRVIAVCYLIRMLESDDSIETIDLRIGTQTYKHKLIIQSDNFEVVSTVPS